MQKRRSKSRFQALKHLFRRRNIIIVSDESIDHYPLGGKIQLFGLMALIGLFSWISYSTGSYMASQAVLQQKEHQIATTVLQNKQLGQEYTLLKRDLMKLKDLDGDLNEYAEYMLKQHEGTPARDFAVAFMGSVDANEQSTNRLIERIDYLESKVANLEDENTQIISAVRERTKDKIKELRELISAAGLNARQMERRAEKELASKVLPEDDGKGGPYIPDELSDLDADFFTDIDRMMLLDAVVEVLPTSSPMPHARLTSSFGRRVDPFTRRWAMHSGQDFSGGHGHAIKAPAAGTVRLAERHGAYGNLVEIDHGLGIRTRFGHLSKIRVKAGQQVKEGQILGNQGSTGRSTGSHLHYEVRLNNRPIDPAKFMKAGQEYVQE